MYEFSGNEEVLRAAVLDRTLAPLMAAQQAALDMVGQQQSAADAVRNRHMQQRAFSPNQQHAPFDDSSYVNRATESLIDTGRLTGRMDRIRGIVAAAPVEELSSNREFDPWKSGYVATTVEEIMTETDISNRKKFERHADKVATLAATDYNRNPLRPTPDFEARRALEHRAKGVIGWAIGTLLDKI